jgi:hypothetical protein
MPTKNISVLYKEGKNRIGHSFFKVSAEKNFFRPIFDVWGTSRRYDWFIARCAGNLARKKNPGHFYSPTENYENAQKKKVDGFQEGKNRDWPSRFPNGRGRKFFSKDQ